MQPSDSIKIGGCRLKDWRNTMYFKRLEDLRIDHDLTQAQVAHILNCQREVYRRYEKGTRTIPIDYLIKLADYYNVSIDYIIGRTDYK